jgi:hypothetical protein
MLQSLAFCQKLATDWLQRTKPAVHQAHGDHRRPEKLWAQVVRLRVVETSAGAAAAQRTDADVRAAGGGVFYDKRIVACAAAPAELSANCSALSAAALLADARVAHEAQSTVFPSGGATPHAAHSRHHRHSAAIVTVPAGYRCYRLYHQPGGGSQGRSSALVCRMWSRP